MMIIYLQKIFQDKQNIYLKNAYILFFVLVFEL